MTSPRWVDTWACNMVMWYWSVAILLWQLSIDHIVNVRKSYIKDVDLPRHAWDISPFLLIVSPTPPVQSVDAYVRMYVRTYVRSVNDVTTKRKEVDHIPWVWGFVPRALRARGSPAITKTITDKWRQITAPDKMKSEVCPRCAVKFYKLLGALLWLVSHCQKDLLKSLNFKDSQTSIEGWPLGNQWPTKRLIQFQQT